MYQLILQLLVQDYIVLVSPSPIPKTHSHPNIKLPRFNNGLSKTILKPDKTPRHPPIRHRARQLTQPNPRIPFVSTRHTPPRSYHRPAGPLSHALGSQSELGMGIAMLILSPHRMHGDVTKNSPTTTKPPPQRRLRCKLQNSREGESGAGIFMAKGPAHISTVGRP